MTVRTESTEAAEFVASLPGRAALEPRTALDPVTTSAVRTWCDAMGDRAWPNGTVTLQTIAPAATLQLWTFPPVSPERATDGPSLPGDFDTELRARLAELGYPATLATAAEYDFLEPIQVGMTLTANQQYVAASSEKQTALGRGFFVTSLAEYRSERGAVVGRVRSSVFHFSPLASGAPAEPLVALQSGPYNSHGTPSEIAPGLNFDTVDVPLTPTQIIAGALATRDIYPVHHDRDFARSHGSRDLLLSIPTTCGLLARIIGEWTGGKRLLTLSIRLRASAYANHVLTVDGHVDRVHGQIAALSLTARSDDGVHADAAASVDLANPRRP